LVSRFAESTLRSTLKCHFGIFTKDEHDRFGITPMSETLPVMTGGRERTEAEFRELYEKSGFRLTRIVPTESPFSVIEGVKM